MTIPALQRQPIASTKPATPLQEWPLKDIVVLDPAWLADVMWSVIDGCARKPADTRWQLHKGDWDSVLEKYDATLRPMLARLMEGLEVTYPARNNDGSLRDYSIVPTMLRHRCLPARLSTVEFGKPGLTSARAACIQVTLSHLPFDFFPRLHGRLQAIVRPDNDCLSHTGGVFREAGVDDAATTGHRALVWQPVLPTCVAEPVAVEVRPGCLRFISFFAALTLHAPSHRFVP